MEVTTYELLPLMVAIMSGLVGTIATLAITFPTRRAARIKVPLNDTSKRLMYASNLLLIGLQNVLQIWANGRAPVSVTFPLACGANLLSILIGQWCLGILKPTKSVRIGTYTLASAVFMLPNVGPSDTPDGVDVVGLLRSMPAISFVVICVVVIVYGIAVISRKSITDNSTLVLLYSLIAGAGTVLNTSITKLVQLNLGILGKTGFVLVYLLLSCLCIGVQAIANSTLADPSAYVPISAGTNLVLNFLAGICIWGDWNRVESRLSYCFIYVLVFLGTYGITSFDFVDQAKPRHLHENDNKGFGNLLFGHADYSYDVAFRAGVHLWKLWETDCVDPCETRGALQMYLKHAINKQLVNVYDFAELVVELAEEETSHPGFSRTKAVEQWLLKHADSFNECRDAYRSSGDAKDGNNGLV